MITPLTPEKKIDERAVETIIEFLVSHEAAPFVLGTTGESASIEDDMRGQIVRKMVQSVRGRAVTYAAISSNSFDTTVRSANLYFDTGVDAVVAHIPGYYPIDEDEMLFYFENLAEKVPGPLILYNITAVTHLSMPLQIVEKLSHHDNVVGLKDSERDLERLQTALKLWKKRSDFSYLIGWGAQMLYGLEQGADGLVPSSGNIIPHLYQDLFLAVRNGNKAEAQRLQEITNEISAIYQRGRSLGQSLAALKIMMEQFDLCGPDMLLPLRQLTENQSNEIVKAMSQFEPYFKKKD
jgi:4-hydroxy-tetrahydrodipicolinate synthase